MTTLTLLLVLLTAPLAAAQSQVADAPEGARIESAEVSGFPIGQLSPGLRQAIRDLVDTPLAYADVTALADRIEEERPDVVAAIRTVRRASGGAEVIFLVARISDDRGLAENINTRYTVEGVGISGVAEDRVSQALRDDLQRLVGARLDQDDADRLADRLKAEVPGFSVGRRISRGSEPGKIRVVFEFRRVEPPAWIPFTPSRSKILYQEDAGWSGVLDVPIDGPRDTRFTIGAVFRDRDELIETTRGYRLRFESRSLGTRRLGAGLEFSTLRQTWHERTLDALTLDPTVPDVYRMRRTVEPVVRFAANEYVRVSGGLSTTELLALESSPAAASRMANAVTFEVSGGPRIWSPPGRGRHRLEARYGFRGSALESDFDYKRHVGEARYEFRHRDSTVVARASVGGITGVAPLFERFSLGDTTTLRGWNTLDIAPLGGRRMFHQSLEYRYHGVGMFLDAGSVWEPGGERKVRVSTGFGFQGQNAFLLWGVPLNAETLSTTFLFGVRF